MLSPVAFATEDDDGAWLIVSASDTFRSNGSDSRWQYWFDAQARYFDIGSGINQYLLRPGIGWKISDNVNAWAGYARIRSRNRAGNTIDEDRFWQQLDWRAGNIFGGKVAMRTRLEQRSLSSGDDTGMVLRFMSRYTRPLGDRGTTSLVIAIEPFIRLNNSDWGGDAGLGQNRSYAGISWKVSEKITVEAGYMHQYIWVDNGTDRVNHVGVLNIKVR
jgi:hypothetical protein